MEKPSVFLRTGTAVILAKGPSRKISTSRHPQPGEHQHHPEMHAEVWQWEGSASRAEQHSTLSVPGAAAVWAGEEESWVTELLPCSPGFALHGQNRHVEQTHLLSLTGMQFSLGVFIYRQIIHLVAQDSEWQTKRSSGDESERSPCSAKLQRDFHSTLTAVIWKGQRSRIFRCECEMRKCLSFYLVSECFRVKPYSFPESFSALHLLNDCVKSWLHVCPAQLCSQPAHPRCPLFIRAQRGNGIARSIPVTSTRWDGSSQPCQLRAAKVLRTHLRSSTAGCTNSPWEVRGQRGKNSFKEA